jgi:tRNA-specific 2-thiouridylase
MRLLDDAFAEGDIRDARALCAQLGISHSVYDMRAEFSSAVINNFVSVYEAGGTPNPCIVCNKHLKFGALLNRALSDGADMIATGHYARIEKSGDRYLLKRAADLSKDQSYVLWMLSQHQLSKTLFPLGSLSKRAVRDMAEARGLITAHKSVLHISQAPSLFVSTWISSTIFFTCSLSHFSHIFQCFNK